MGGTRERRRSTAGRIQHRHPRHEEDHVDGDRSRVEGRPKVHHKGLAGRPRLPNTNIRPQRNRTERTVGIGGTDQDPSVRW